MSLSLTSHTRIRTHNSSPLCNPMVNKRYESERCIEPDIMSHNLFTTRVTRWLCSAKDAGENLLARVCEREMVATITNLHGCTPTCHRGASVAQP